MEKLRKTDRSFTYWLRALYMLWNHGRWRNMWIILICMGQSFLWRWRCYNVMIRMIFMIRRRDWSGCKCMFCTLQTTIHPISNNYKRLKEKWKRNAEGDGRSLPIGCVLCPGGNTCEIMGDGATSGGAFTNGGEDSGEDVGIGVLAVHWKPKWRNYLLLKTIKGEAGRGERERERETYVVKMVLQQLEHWAIEPQEVGVQLHFR